MDFAVDCVFLAEQLELAGDDGNYLLAACAGISLAVAMAANCALTLEILIREFRNQEVRGAVLVQSMYVYLLKQRLFFLVLRTSLI